MQTIIRHAVLYATAALAAASAQPLYAQAVDFEAMKRSLESQIELYRQVNDHESRIRALEQQVGASSRDVAAGAVAKDAERTAAPSSKPAITIAVAPFYCAPCNALKAMDWSGFDVSWQTGGAAAFPEISWRDSRGVKRTLTGAYRPDQVLWSWQQTQGATSEATAAAHEPTPYSKVAEGLEYAGLKPGQSLLDIGCGDGRVLMVAAEQFDAKATGIELDVNQAQVARDRLSGAGLIDRTDVLAGDATKMELPAADVAYVYLYPDTLAALKTKLERFDTVVSYMHAVPGMAMSKRGDFYVWRKSQPQAATPVAVRSGCRNCQQPAMRQQPVAVWGGRTYSGPVCNSPGCRMCASIRAQLYGRR